MAHLLKVEIKTELGEAEQIFNKIIYSYVSLGYIWLK